MNEKLKLIKIFTGFIISFIFIFPLFAQEQITVGTYYPAPMGVYNSFSTETLGVGNNDNVVGLSINDAPDADAVNDAQSGDFWVEGNVAIGDPDSDTNNLNSLNVAGSVAIGENYAGTVAPSNGLIVEGNISVGRITPNADLEVNHSMRFDPATFANLRYDTSNPEGTLYYDASEDVLKYHDGTDWVPFGGGGGVTLGTVVEVLSDFISTGSSFPQAKALCPTADNSDYDYVVTGYKFYTDNDCPASCRTTLPEIHRIGIICTALE